MPAIIPFIPLIASGIGAATSAYSAHKAGQTAKSAQEQQQQIFGAAKHQADIESGAGQNLISGGMGPLGRATSYYDTLLRGNRAAMTQAVSPAIRQLSDVSRGETSALERSGVRGAARDVASADIARRQSSGIASLMTGVQPQAAGALGALGGQQLSLGANLLGQAGNVYGGMFGPSSYNAAYQTGLANQAAGNFGSSLADVLRAWPTGKSGSTGTGRTVDTSFYAT